MCLVRPSIRRDEGESDDFTVIKGGNITLHCAAEGVPQPAVSWLKDGRPITGQHSAKVLNDGRLLQIRDAEVTDTGRYTCVSVNVAGQADSKYDVNVHGITLNLILLLFLPDSLIFKGYVTPLLQSLQAYLVRCSHQKTSVLL